MINNPQNSHRIVGGIYRVGQVIRNDGILTTCTAYDRNTNDIVTLFIIELPPTIQQSRAQQLLEPLQTRRHSQSPHILHIHNWGIDGSYAYIAADPPRGITLQHVLDNENISIRRAIDMTRQLAIGLKEFHTQGIVGLDLRPQLITVDTIGVADRVQIDDIGLRILLNALGYIDGQRVDDIGYFDPHYTAPELINSGQIGPWTDIYQLGLLLFTMVTGRLPFTGQNHAETGIMQSTNPVPRMASYTHNTPPDLQNLVDCALAKDPAQRFPNTLVLINALESIQIASPQRPIQGIIAAQPGNAQTKEMQPVNEDVTLVATLLEEPAPSQVQPVQPSQVEEGIYAYLHYEKPGEKAQYISLTQKSTIVGRLDPKRGLTPDIDLSEMDPKMTVSRQHARIRFEETFFYIEDLKSRNKTRLGELALVPLKAELLQHGDILYFGSVRMRFEIPGKGKLPPMQEKQT